MQAVKKHFSFLESEYAFNFEGFAITKDSDFRNKVIWARYRTEHAGVSIKWWIGDPGFCVKLWQMDDYITSGRRSAAGSDASRHYNTVYLDNYVENLTGGEIKRIGEFNERDIIQIITKYAFKERGTIEDVIESYAQKLQKYGTEILKGDFSKFALSKAVYRDIWSLEANQQIIVEPEPDENQ